MGPVVVIVGRPNVGKSTLFNRLTRSRSALVDDRPGITRDRLHGIINHEGITMTLVDTGGFEDLGQDLLQRGVRTQVKTAITEADLVILMVDGREGVLPGDEEMARILRKSQKKVFLAANKIDGPEHDHLANDFYQLGYETVYAVSAAHGYGLNALLHELVKDLPSSPPLPLTCRKNPTKFGSPFWASPTWENHPSSIEFSRQIGWWSANCPERPAIRWTRPFLMAVENIF